MLHYVFQPEEKRTHSGIVFVDRYSVCQNDIDRRTRHPSGYTGKLDEQVKDRLALQ